jgi:hypothetical protein
MEGLSVNQVQEAIRLEFEKRCLSLLNLAYIESVFQEKISTDWEEEAISAVLIDLMNKSEESQNWNIDIAPEHRIYKDEHLTGLESPKKAPRIDFRFCSFESNRKLVYFMEAKNLAEENWRKPDNTTDTIALNLQNRYIETGLKKFISGEYPMGCLIGYVMQGEPDHIIFSINGLIVTQGLDCIIQRIDNIYFDFFYYESEFLDGGRKIIIKQILLRYS